MLHRARRQLYDRNQAFNRKTPSSKARFLKNRSEIANLDSWQKAAAIETPDGPQRIRGLAGSGKTIVLALKAAYLLGENPDWRIGVTFHTRALRQQFRQLNASLTTSRNIARNPMRPLLIMHSFGSQVQKGIYAKSVAPMECSPETSATPKRTYGFNNAFEGICAELLKVVERDPKVIFDALLIDEAQDLPKEFSEACVSLHC